MIGKSKNKDGERLNYKREITRNREIAKKK